MREALRLEPPWRDECPYETGKELRSCTVSTVPGRADVASYKPGRGPSQNLTGPSP